MRPDESDATVCQSGATNRSARRTLIAECATVLARLRAPDQRATIPIDLDGLRATPGRACHSHIVSSCFESVDRRCRLTVLDVGLLTLKEETWRVDCLLHVHAVVEHIEDDLNVTHRLVVRAHDAEAHIAATIAHRECRNDRMHRAFAGTENVRVTLLQREASPAIGEHDACLLCTDSGAEAGIQRIDEGNSGPVAINDRQVDRVVSGRGRAW